MRHETAEFQDPSIRCDKVLLKAVHHRIHVLGDAITAPPVRATILSMPYRSLAATASLSTSRSMSIVSLR